LSLVSYLLLPAAGYCLLLLTLKRWKPACRFTSRGWQTGDTDNRR